MFFPKIDIQKVADEFLDMLRKISILVLKKIKQVKLGPDFKRYTVNSVILIVSITVSVLLISHIPDIRRIVVSEKNKSILFFNSENDSIKAIHASLEKSFLKLQKRAASYTPSSPYMVVNTSLNEFFMYQNRKLVRYGKCSTGSYVQLEGSDRRWIFKTPRGEFRIHGKTTSPVWKKPDWAFVEEGMPVPPSDHPSRYEYGVLGDYALSIGQGYLIHGTLYKRYLGAAVTHGCIRLNDEDLEKVYKTMVIGSRVYIY